VIEDAGRPLLTGAPVAVYSAPANTSKQIGARREIRGRDFYGNTVSAETREEVNECLRTAPTPEPAAGECHL